MPMGQHSDQIVKIMIFVVHNFGDKANAFLFINIACCIITLKVLVTTIDALRHFETG